MLSMLILLAATPQSVPPAIPALPDSLSRSAEPRATATMRVYGRPSPACTPGPMVARYARPGSETLMWRQGDQPVAHYLLLERRVNGCSAPIVVNYRVPGSNAIGREVLVPHAGDSVR